MADQRRRDSKEKKVDLKGRILYENEHQRLDDKHFGLYEYKYYDKDGKRRTVSSWKLNSTDRLPTGKRDCIALRELEKQIEKGIQTGCDYYSAHSVTVNDVFDRYISAKENLRESTLVNYKYTYDHWIREDFGKRLIGNVVNSDIMNLYAGLLKDGFKVNTLDNIHTLIFPTFKQAVKDGIIPNNPAAGAMGDLKRSKKWKSRKRIALTEEQQNALEDFLLTDGACERWASLFLTMLWSGCRIGEVTGLTWKDINFEEKIINVDHALSYRPNAERKCLFQINPTKTEAGVRSIPMKDDLCKILLKEKDLQSMLGYCKTKIDGYENFAFYNRFNEAFTPMSVNRALKRIVNRCNAAEEAKAKKEGRKAIVIPEISAHNLRHTFCTRLCEVEDNIGIIMQIMGHTDSATTLEIYNDVQEAKKKRSFESIRKKMQKKPL